MELDKRLIVLQPITAIMLVLVSLIGTVIPYIVLKAKKFMAIMSYLNCCVGGVLSAVALLHIIPEAGSFINPALNDFPMSYCIIFTGMIVMILIIKLGEAQPVSPKIACDITEYGGRSTPSEVPADFEVEQIIVAEQPSKNSYIMLFIGLTIHDLSEGIMLGLQTNYEHTIYLSLALVLHKWCESCCQVVTGIRKGVEKKHNILVSVGLSVASPIAQIVAFVIMLATNKNRISDSLYITEGIFMSFAAGTFLTIILVEIINDELDGKSRSQIAYRLLASVGGFLFICACSIIEYTLE